jgi:hypothetical protein
MDNNFCFSIPLKNFIKINNNNNNNNNNNKIMLFIYLMKKMYCGIMF